MSGLAHYLEDEGLSTVVVALVREHVVKMSPPRALWVPFEMGRPIATPNDVERQHRVLKAALGLLDEQGSEPILKDYTEQTSYPSGDSNWEFPADINAESVLEEARALLPIWQNAQAKKNRTTFGISGMSPETTVDYIDRYLSTDPMPNPKGMAPVSRARFAVDDIKVFYFEAAFANDSHPSSFQMNEWFWNQTLAGKMILDFQHAACRADDKNLRLIADSLIPPERTYEYLQSQ